MLKGDGKALKGQYQTDLMGNIKDELIIHKHNFKHSKDQNDLYIGRCDCGFITHNKENKTK